MPLPWSLVVKMDQKPEQALRRDTLTEICYRHKHGLPIDRFGSANDPAPFVRSVNDRIHAVQDKIENDLL